MKRLPILGLLALLLLSLAACDGAGDTPAEWPTLDLVGEWTFVHETFGDDETPHPHVYGHFITPSIIIYADDTMVWTAYGSRQGDLVRTGDYHFSVTNIIARSEGQTWYPDERDTLIYHPERELLQYTRLNEYSETYMHMFFERVS